MTRPGAVSLILLCSMLSGCATTRRYEGHLLPTLIGSLRIVEAEAALQVGLESEEATYRAVTTIVNRTIDDLRRVGWPVKVAFVAPNCPGGIHCPDSKCTAAEFGAFCSELEERYRRVFEEGWRELALSIYILEMEVMLRFAHAPNSAMAAYLNRRLAQTYTEMRARKGR